MTRVQRIEALNLSRRFGSTLALRRVSIAFEAGAICLLEGPNGAGKSTLLAVLGTVLKPTSGSVRYHPLGDDLESVRRELGFVAHESHCYRDLSVRQNVELVARVHGLDPESAWERAARRVDAHALADRTVHTLSRGQRQRVALARALVHEPSVLLLDEPWTGLDRGSSELLERVLREERERGALVIAVTHGEGVAERLGAHRVRLEAGRVVRG